MLFELKRRCNIPPMSDNEFIANFRVPRLGLTSQLKVGYGGVVCSLSGHYHWR